MTKKCSICGFRLSEITHKIYLCTNSFCKRGFLSFTTMSDKEIKIRLEYLRKELRNERISYSDILELQHYVKYIEPGDIELLEAAGVPEAI